MSIIDQLVYKITGDTSSFNSAITKANTSVNGLSTNMTKNSKAAAILKKGLKALTAGLSITAGFVLLKNAVKNSAEAFGNFETSLDSASTLFGGVDVDMSSLESQVLNLSSSTGILTSEIGDGLYSALSAGVPVTEDMTGAMDFMTKSAKLAKAGFTDVDTAVSSTAKTMNAYGMTLDDVDYINTVLIQTQNDGITTVGELGQSLAMVTPTAAAFGVSFDQVGASLAVMTAQGTKTAMATTQLNTLIAELGKAGTTGATSLASAATAAGLTETSFTDLLNSGKDLGDILQIIRDYADKSGLSMVDMFSSIEAGKTGLALTGDNLVKFKKDLDDMNTSADVVGTAYEKVMDSWSEQTTQLKTSMENLGISIQKKLLPSLGTGITRISSLINKMTGNKTAGDELEGTFGDLKTALSNYNDILDDSAGKTDALTQAMVSQAAQALHTAILKSGQDYADTSTEIAKYTTNVKNAETSLAKWNGKLEDYADDIGISSDSLNTMGTNQDRYNAIMATGNYTQTEAATLAAKYTNALDRRVESQNDLISNSANLDKATTQENAYVALLTQGYIEQDDATNLILDTYPKLKEKVMDNVDAYEAQAKAVQEAQDSLEELKNKGTLTDAELENAQTIGEYWLQNASSAKEASVWTEYLAEVQSRLTKKEDEGTASAEDLAKKEDARTAILKTETDGIIAANAKSELLGDAYDANSAKASIYLTAIEDLIANGEDPQSKTLVGLVNDYLALQTATEETTTATKDFTESFQDMAANRAEAYKTMASDSQSTTESFISDLQEQARSFLEAGASIVDVKKWEQEQLDQYNEDEKESSIAAAEASRDAWIDYGTDVASSISSTWGYINDIKDNANDKELTRLQGLVDATEEGSDAQIAAEQNLVDAKNAFAEEEAKRSKALATFNAVIDTASAVIGFLADPGGIPGYILSGLAVTSGATQIAAINSAEVPSYAVGTIDVPQDTPANLHKGETVLTAGITSEAKSQGITIEPKNSAKSSNSLNIMLYLDSEVLAKKTVDKINLGQAGTISLRVVK